MAPLTGDPNAHAVSEFATSITGTCLCGSIRVTVHENLFAGPQRGHLCHCANCRKIAGSFCAANLLIEAEKVTLADRNGTLKTFADFDTGSGKPVMRSFCSVDGW
jgi:hypothetical protein